MKLIIMLDIKKIQEKLPKTDVKEILAFIK